MFRAVYAGEEPVGFLMLSERRSVPRYYLWRFMIDETHQGKRYGGEAMKAFIEYVRQLPNATELYGSYVPGEALLVPSTPSRDSSIPVASTTARSRLC